MNTKLIAYTMPSQSFINEILDNRTDEDNCIDTRVTSQDIISYCARVSNPSNQENFETAGGLLRYCMNKQHWSIFEMVNVVFEINTSRTIARQILRHRSFSFQEFSQRYADPTQMEFLESEARLQDINNRQNSIDLDPHTAEQIITGWKSWQKLVIDTAKEAYLWATNKNNGLAKEISRDVLPEGLTPSRMYMQGTLRSWIHYCILRMGNGTQKEHREIAKDIWEKLKELYPFLKDYQWIECKFTNEEADFIAKVLDLVSRFDIDTNMNNKDIAILNSIENKLQSYFVDRLSQ